MENLNIESRYLKLCYVFRAVIRCIKAVFYRPDYQNLLMCLLIKRLSRAFVSKHATELLKRPGKLLKHLPELLKNWAKLLRT